MIILPSKRSACNLDVESHMVLSFIESEKYQGLLKFNMSNGQLRLALSTFYANRDQWNPGKNHFILSLEEWNWVIDAVGLFEEDMKPGETFIRLTARSLVCK